MELPQFDILLLIDLRETIVPFIPTLDANLLAPIPNNKQHPGTRAETTYIKDLPAMSDKRS
ncbi:MAG: hypothetical protein OEM83_05040, partial [Gammaproteobacteria bacterium]|nr:hypothetical protein [Gammaproteobacteria bacterium]